MPDNNWTLISGSTPQDYTDTAVFEVNPDTKQIALITGQALVAGEKDSQYISFLMPRYWDGIDISDKSFTVEYALAGTYYGTSEAVNAEMTTEQVRFGWIVPETACAISGTLLFVLKITSEDYILKTQIVEHPVFKTINVEDVVPEPTKEAWYIEFQNRVDGAISEAEAAVDTAQATLTQVEASVGLAQTAAQEAQTAEGNAEAAAAIAQIRYGSPLVAQIADEMVEQNRVYVYTGSETGYTAGHWYYYDGTAWVSGGVYNGTGINTDTTLTQAGMAADAKATGDEISQIKEDFTDMVNSAYVIDSAGGSVAHFVDGADNVPMKSLKVNIRPVQSGSGDPSPSNVRAISGKTSVTLMRAGKNLITPLSKTESGLTLTPQSDGGVLINGTFTGATGWFVISTNVRLKAEQTYTLSLSGMEITYGMNGYGSSNPVTPNADFVSNFRLRIENGQTFNNVLVYAQVEVGATATNFEAGVFDSYTISLSSAGTVYGGTLDVVSGVLTVDREYVPMTAELWKVWNNSVKAAYTDGVYNNREIVACDSLRAGELVTNGIKVRAADGRIGALPEWAESCTTLAEFKTALAQNPAINIVIPLATPLTYQLSATEIKSLLGINNVWSDAGDMDVEYRANTKLYIKRLTDSDTDMIADSNIVSGQYFMVGNNLYKATANIASGSAVIVGTNAIRKSLSEALNEINA